MFRKWTVRHATENRSEALQRAQIVKRFQNRCDTLVRPYQVFEGRDAWRIELQPAVGKQLRFVQHALQLSELAAYRRSGRSPRSKRRKHQSDREARRDRA